MSIVIIFIENVVCTYLSYLSLVIMVIISIDTVITHTYFTYITKAGRAVVMRNHDGKVLQFTNTI